MHKYVAVLYDEDSPAGGGSEVIFVSVDLGANVMPSMTNSSDQDCSFEFPDAVYPSMPKVLTEVAMVCP